MLERNNCFDFLRLVFACFVVITHSYALAGINQCDWLCQYTDGQTVLSYLGVRGFFIISGFLIFQSLIRSKTVAIYYWKRLLRLYPGLIFVITLTILLAPILYPGSIIDYIYEEDVHKYIRDNLLLFQPRDDIAGVFKNNPYRNTINGSLWTLSYEFTMYVLLSFLFVIKYRITVLKYILGTILIFTLIGNLFFQDLVSQYNYFLIFNVQLLELGYFFIAGSLLASIDISTIRFGKVILLISFISILISFWAGWFNSSKYILLPVFIIILGLQNVPFISNISEKIGDLSYGIYIFSFPVQQTLQHYFQLNYLHLMWSSLLITLIFALISWHLIEAQALKYKKLPETLKLKFNKFELNKYFK